MERICYRLTSDVRVGYHNILESETLYGPKLRDTIVNLPTIGPKDSTWAAMK